MTFTSPTSYKQNFDFLYAAAVSYERVGEEDRQNGVSSTNLTISIMSGGVRIGRSTVTAGVDVFSTGDDTSIAAWADDLESLTNGFEFDAKDTIIEKAIPAEHYKEHEV